MSDPTLPRACSSPALAPLLLGAALLLGCGVEPPPPGRTASAGDEAPGTDPASDLDPRVADVRRALEAGLPEAAWTLLDQLGDSLGVDGALLRARAALTEGDAVGALREVADARSMAPEDARVLGTEVEVLAALDRLGAARAALRTAWKVVGRTAELERARGVLLLRTPGGGDEALAALLGARSLDPDLPFVSFPLAQAHLLAGRLAQKESAPARALEHARSGLELLPQEPDLRELAAEALVGSARFEEAIELYEGLEAEGRELGATLSLLHQRCATRLLLELDRAAAIEHYLRARDLGLDDEGLGFGATLLADVAVEWIDRGIESYGKGELEAACASFEEALRLDPECLEARNHLGIARFARGEHRAAAEAWEAVVRSAGSEGVELPDPVHLNLARAWELAGERARARAVLEAYLLADPGGPWEAETRQRVASLAPEHEAD